MSVTYRSVSRSVRGGRCPLLPVSTGRCRSVSVIIGRVFIRICRLWEVPVRILLGTIRRPGWLFQVPIWIVLRLKKLMFPRQPYHKISRPFHLTVPCVPVDRPSSIRWHTGRAVVPCSVLASVCTGLNRPWHFTSYFVKFSQTLLWICSSTCFLVGWCP